MEKQRNKEDIKTYHVWQNGRHKSYFVVITFNLNRLNSPNKRNWKNGKKDDQTIYSHSLLVEW